MIKRLKLLIAAKRWGVNSLPVTVPEVLEALEALKRSGFFREIVGWVVSDHPAFEAPLMWQVHDDGFGRYLELWLGSELLLDEAPLDDSKGPEGDDGFFQVSGGGEAIPKRLEPIPVLG